ncbi:bis(5'-nucleosyl)-tetraphosphatase (symmetrical) YqeK [Paenibacillus sp. FSL R7-0048]|jgi:predicted HD superfamily hydrolase involved in NAD metabolism|uniref:bis(5'-nucleosyl)-tetraphosphatase (symmetrical) n=1 Tax=Paenibacillus odorifer TaxID=189426 RepID=A0A1R0WMS8_9BACL|nr:MULTISPECIES: bis(5'-nucleosyl)-tetraphosphatase (symmetrical) YqeK [Paenibacillus]AWV32475.1 HD domain-containing protein [Paenibacillus odorifer]MDH6425935.1 putative HD superfamily hydrolase involved in NAD metabolism [Paenibacillus sp. PastH-4]MDH6441956.1 putative HD superfamily hydrolase involved in NAD metabolism [Paenibacillus sp. PastF-4]MDH6527329.1 putative HD superfamily hydrolase involved in NAD metabolism [Paenibacillus sp. PastH-3]OMC65230.1 phosphohydrolase [Paenibacillus od
MAYSREALIEAVSAQMPDKRWKHTLGVMETSIQLAKQYGADPERAETAAILHDVAKYWPVERMKEIIEQNQLNLDLLVYDKQMWHSEVGAFVAEKDYGITDPDIINAIRFHTSGREDMSLLEKIVCLADYIEPGRDFPGVDKIREKAQVSLEEGLVAGFDSTISLLLEKRRVIFPLTVLARNDLVRILEDKI